MSLSAGKEGAAQGQLSGHLIGPLNPPLKFLVLFHSGNKSSSKRAPTYNKQMLSVRGFKVWVQEMQAEASQPSRSASAGRLPLATLGSSGEGWGCQWRVQRADDAPVGDQLMRTIRSRRAVTGLCRLIERCLGVPCT